MSTALKLAFPELRKISSCGELDVMPKDVREVHRGRVGHGSLVRILVIGLTRNVEELMGIQLGRRYGPPSVRSPRLGVSITCYLRRTTTVRQNLRGQFMYISHPDNNCSLFYAGRHRQIHLGPPGGQINHGRGHPRFRRVLPSRGPFFSGTGKN